MAAQDHEEIEKFQEAVIIRTVNTVGSQVLEYEIIGLQKHSSATCLGLIQIGGVIPLYPAHITAHRVKHPASFFKLDH